MGKNNIRGAWGEAKAAEYLAAHRYKIICNGYRCRFGEIDLIAQDKTYLIFAEVKTRSNSDFAEAREFVSYQKQNKLRSTASVFLSEHPTKLQPRFDVIEIYAPMGTQTKDPKIEHIMGAFE